MQINFNSLQKPMQMSQRKSGALFFYGQVVLGTLCSNLLSTFDLVQKCQICAFNENTDNLLVDQVISTTLRHVKETHSNSWDTDSEKVVSTFFGIPCYICNGCIKCFVCTIICACIYRNKSLNQ